MDKTRGMLVVGGSFALLAAGAAVTYLIRKRAHEESVEELAKVEEMIDEYEEYVEREAPVKPKKKRVTHARNGKTTPAVG